MVLLKAPSGYDISHSEPRWPADIFVSVPERDDDIGAIRFAESVVHEAMHLHLSNFERRFPLVANTPKTMMSPWRSEQRPVQGILHGLFVFSCLYNFFEQLSDKALVRQVKTHCASRLVTIGEEIRSIDLEELGDSLTQVGKALAFQWRLSSDT